MFCLVSKSIRDSRIGYSAKLTDNENRAFCSGTNGQYEGIETVTRSHKMDALMVRELLMIRAWHFTDAPG